MLNSNHEILWTIFHISICQSPALKLVHAVLLHWRITNPINFSYATWYVVYLFLSPLWSSARHYGFLKVQSFNSSRGSLCIIVPVLNFATIGQTLPEIWQFSIFKMAAYHHHSGFLKILNLTGDRWEMVNKYNHAKFCGDRSRLITRSPLSMANYTN